MKIAVLAKLEKPGVSEAVHFLKDLGCNVKLFGGEQGRPFPTELYDSNYDILISYISPWIVPKRVLSRTKYWNINFHPGPPEYPGIGCFNFAIYYEEKTFGCTAHIMNDKVDTGEIIAVKRFSINPEETVVTLADKTYDAILDTFKKVFNSIVLDGNLPASTETWQRKPYKRKELEELATIDVKMPVEEIKKRIRATYYPGKPAPFIDLNGYRFEYNPER